MNGNKKMFLAITTVILVVASCLSPLMVTSVKAEGEVLAYGQYHISANVGGSFEKGYKYPNYARNMRMYFAYVSVDRDLAKISTIDLNNFSGSYDFVHDPTWLNGVYGPYCKSQGMVDAEVGKTKLGGGACNTSSMVADVLARVPGVVVDSFSDHYWAAIPEVDPKYQLQVGTGCGSADPTKKSGNSDNDVRVVGAKGLTLHWSVVGDVITLWVTRTGENVPAPTGPIPTQSQPQVQSQVQPSSGDATSTNPASMVRKLLEGYEPYRMAEKTGVIDGDLVVKIVTWFIYLLLATLALFLYALLKGKVDRLALPPAKYIHLKGGRYLKVEEPRKYLGGWYRFFLVVFGILLFFVRDYVFRTLGWEVWRTTLGLAVFFWFAKRADIARIRAEKPISKPKRWLWNTATGWSTLLVASYVWGITVGLVLYALGGNFHVSAAESRESTGAGKPSLAEASARLPGWGLTLGQSASLDLIPAIWDQVFAGVQDEGGNLDEALLLYYVQRSEFSGVGSCTELDHKACTSWAGAQGWFQFMPGTWKTYADSSWSRSNIRQSARAAYRMFKKLKLFEPTTRFDFQTRFTGRDRYNGGLCWNLGVPDSAAYDGWDQSGSIWNNYQAALVRLNQVAETSTPQEVGGVTYDTADLMWPIDDPGRLMSNRKGMHSKPRGKDVSCANCASPGTVPVLATMAGEIRVLVDADMARYYQPDNSGLGNTWLVIYNSASGWSVTYLHLCIMPGLKQGDMVSKGQIIGGVCSIGNSTGPHIHYAVESPDGVVDLTWIH